MIEPRGPEVVPQALVEPLVLAERDAGEHRSALPRRDALECLVHASPEPVGDGSQPTAAADDPEAARSKNDVDALATEIARLVEVSGLLGGTRRCDRGHGFEDGALWRRSLRGQVEAGSLVQLEVAEAPAPEPGRAVRTRCGAPAR